MYSRVSDHSVWQRWKTAKRLALLVAFEDSVAGMRVKEFCRDLARNVGQQCQIVEHVWLFSTLRQRELQEIAAEEALQADLIVISALRAEEAPDGVQRWIELWLRQKGSRPEMLVALLDPPYDGAPVATEEYLQQVAKRGSMEFLVESLDVTLPR
jgi:hypothetical protein